MLENTFIHIPGLGPTAERSLWNQGCHSWSHLLDGVHRYSVGQVDDNLVKETLEASHLALSAGEHQFFSRRLNLKDAWRAWPEFRSSCVYLDIETDGGNSGDSITTIGMYDGETFQCLIKGQDLGNFPDIISHYSMIVTFYGSGFDLPMLSKGFGGLRFDQIHLDLCPTLRRLGIRGGLKKIEKQLGISRGEDTEGLDGMDAIRLWRRYKGLRDESALEQLIAYNREDVVNLQWLANYAYSHLRAETIRGTPLV